MRCLPARVLAMVLVQLAVSVPPVCAADPRVPPGRDPGGVAIAIIGGGLDYTREDLLPKLARDGEGELVGWDFVDEDRRPFAETGGFDALARIVVRASPQARIIPVRVARGDERQIARALRVLDETPARLVLLAADPGQPIERAKLATAARSLARLLIVVPARLAEPPPVNVIASSGAVGLLIVAAGSSAAADVSVLGAPAPPPSAEAHPDDVASARVTALAARLLAKETSLAGAALRARILALAAEAGGRRVIADIERHP